MTDLEKHTNKMSNTLRLTGIMLCVSSAIGFVTASKSMVTFVNLEIFVLAMIFVVGTCLIVVSSLQWGLIKRFGTSEARMIYFFDNDINKLD